MKALVLVRLLAGVSSDVQLHHRFARRRVRTVRALERLHARVHLLQQNRRA